MRGSVKLGENDWDERQCQVAIIGDGALHQGIKGGYLAAGEIDHHCGRRMPN
jgi:hypothetical protein